MACKENTRWETKKERFGHHFSVPNRPVELGTHTPAFWKKTEKYIHERKRKRERESVEPLVRGTPPHQEVEEEAAEESTLAARKHIPGVNNDDRRKKVQVDDQEDERSPDVEREKIRWKEKKSKGKARERERERERERQTETQPDTSLIATTRMHEEG